MISKKIWLIAAAMSFGIASSSAQNKQDAIWGRFTGSTPCSSPSRPLPGIPQDMNCELIQWKLTLYGDAASKEPGRFELCYAFGMSQPNTRGLMDGGIEAEISGTWSIIHGLPSNPLAIVYSLANPSGKPISFLRLGNDMLQLLDDEGHLMIGNGGWSYTLNRASHS